MPAHIVNAYYHPTLNEIVFPAGILQPPLFDAEADDAVNFGGIGMVVAHEITHGFDDQGRRFDADGALREWWTPEDAERFTALADQLVAQFDAYTVLDDVHINGKLTLGENIADLGGLALAARAHARVAADAPEIDGLTPAQRFFLANATLWRANMSPELERTLAGVDPHSPRELRVRGPVSNLNAFRDAFGLPDDAPIMRAAGGAHRDLVEGLAPEAVEHRRHDGLAAVQAGAVEQRGGTREAGATQPAGGAVERRLHEAGGQQRFGDVGHALEASASKARVPGRSASVGPGRNRRLRRSPRSGPRGAGCGCRPGRGRRRPRRARRRCRSRRGRRPPRR